ncbi:MAG: hypothetical protein DHS20C12_17700 [Pseudohongiella sp.]|nr:MAG: hypothetical protein DHS20C12_17700 [Pseudohongiella sp.]
MTAFSVIAALNILEQQHALLFLLIDLSLKSTVILSLAFAIQFLISGRSTTSSTKSIVWMMAFAALILLPLFNQILPKIAFSVNSEADLASNMASLQIDAVAASLFGLSLGYLLISGLLLCYLLSGILKVVILTRFARPFTHEIAQRSLQQLQQINGCDRPIELLVSAKISSPLTWGVRRHKIIFPLAARGWSEELLQQSISHELGHVQRGDWMLQIAARLAVSLYWINPLTWLAHRQLLLEMEMACDDVAVENSRSPLSYAQNLLTLANSFSSQRSLAASALLGVQSSLSRRIRHILRQEVNGRSSDTSNILPSLFVAALVVAPLSALSLEAHEIELPISVRFEVPVIAVSFFPNGSKEHEYLMAEFR